MNVLIIEDDIDFRETLAQEFREMGKYSYICSEINEIPTLKENYTHAIVDLRLKDQSGLDFIPIIREKFPKIKITMLTAFGSIATSVKAIKLGADNYLLKPCSFKELLIALEYSHVSEELAENELPGLYKKEREYIEYVLMVHGGNITKAAESLGIRRQSLQRKLKKYPPRK